MCQCFSWQTSSSPSLLLANLIIIAFSHLCFQQTGYLLDQTFQCVRNIRDLSSECELTPALKASTYFQNFRIIPVSFFLSCHELGFTWNKVY